MSTSASSPVQTSAAACAECASRNLLIPGASQAPGESSYQSKMSADILCQQHSACIAASQCVIHTHSGKASISKYLSILHECRLKWWDGELYSLWTIIT